MLGDQVVLETEIRILFLEREWIMVWTRSLKCLRSSGGMGGIDLSMKRDRHLGIISIREAVKMIITDMIIYERCIE